MKLQTNRHMFWRARHSLLVSKTSTQKLLLVDFYNLQEKYSYLYHFLFQSKEQLESLSEDQTETIFFLDFPWIQYCWLSFTLANVNYLLIQYKFQRTFSSFTSQSHSFFANFSIFLTYYFRNWFSLVSWAICCFILISLSLLYQLISLEQQSSSLVFCSNTLSFLLICSFSEYILSNYFLREWMIFFFDLISYSSSLFFYSRSIFSIKLIYIHFSFQSFSIFTYFFNLLFQSTKLRIQSSNFFLCSFQCQFTISFSLNRLSQSLVVLTE